jgi:neutral ceramidase
MKESKVPSSVVIARSITTKQSRNKFEIAAQKTLAMTKNVSSGQAGFYTADITPSIGMEGPGGYGKRYISSMHDPLKVRAAVISDGKKRTAIVGIDSLVVRSSEDVEEIRREIEKRTGINPAGILIAASHTHSGGPFFGLAEEEYSDAPELIKTLIAKYSTIPDPAYCRYVKKQIFNAVVEADRKRVSAVFSAGRGFEKSVVFNRRFRMNNGRTFTHPGKNNPNILEPAGSVDPDVGVLAAWDKAGNLLGCIVNYACHGTTGPGGVSADWIYYMEKTILGAMNKDAVVVFLNGACGDVTQVNNLSCCENEFGEKYARLVGTRVGAEALKVIASAEKGEFVPVSFSQKFLSMKRRKPSPKRVEENLKVVKEGLAGNKTDTTEWTFAKELLIADYLYEKQPEVRVEVQGIQTGPVVFLANPAEFFCSPGLEIKKGSKFPLTFVVELANGCVGYVPDEEAFKPSGGGYETILTSYSNLEISAGRKIVDASLKIAGSFKPGALPEPQKVDSPSTLWSYGILGPDLE